MATSTPPFLSHLRLLWTLLLLGISAQPQGRPTDSGTSAHRRLASADTGHPARRLRNGGRSDECSHPALPARWGRRKPKSSGIGRRGRTPARSNGGTSPP